MIELLEEQMIPLQAVVENPLVALPQSSGHDDKLDRILQELRELRKDLRK